MATIDILIPTYNGAKYILPTIRSILNQTYKNFRIIVCDDASTDNTLKLIRQLHHPKIKIYSHSNNLGYSLNLKRASNYATAKYIYLMGQDDILAKDALKETIQAFNLSPDIGAVTRPYFWFDKEINLPVRTKHQLDSQKDTIVKITDSPSTVIKVFETLDQLSGLAFRKKFMKVSFHPDIFPCHIYPFASIFKNHPIVFLKNYTIAVRIASSQTRFLSSIYQKSPLLSWVEMVNYIFDKPKYQKIKHSLISNFIAKNYIGLVQIKNYSTLKNLFREIFYLIKFRPQNLFSPQFYFFSLGTFIIPAQILIPLVDWYKNKINSKFIKKINFTYKI